MQDPNYRAYCRLELFEFEMNKLNTIGGKCFFMGSSEKVLALIKQRVKVDYPDIEVETYSPPYKPEVSGRGQSGDSRSYQQGKS